MTSVEEGARDPLSVEEWLRSVDQLRESDVTWSTAWHPTVLELKGSNESVRAVLRGIERLAPHVIEARLTGTFGSTRLRYRVESGRPVFTSQEGGDLDESFGVSSIDTARLAAQGNFEAAQKLEGSWAASVRCDPLSILKTRHPGVSWLLFADRAALNAYFDEVPFWRTLELFPDERPTVALVRDLSSESSLSTPVLSIASTHTAEPPLPSMSGTTIPRSTCFEGLLALTPSPASLLPAPEVPEALVDSASRLLRISSAVAWAEIATNVRLAEAEDGLEAEFFGLQRVTHALPTQGLTLPESDARASVSLAAWATHGTDTDRLLATRQVSSLRFDAPPWEHPKDIRLAAESVFFSLRSETVAETLRSQREAKAAAIDAANNAVQASATLAQRALERCLAGLLAVGGVMVAQTTSTLTDSQAHDLRVLVSVALAALALWSVAIDRPAMWRVLTDHEADVELFNELLAKADQQRILGMHTIAGAKRQMRVVTVAVPGLYLASAISALIVR